MLSPEFYISTANETHAQELTDLSIQTFTDTFAADNKPEDMAKYIAGAMNAEKLREELQDPVNKFFVAWGAKKMIGYAKLRPNNESESLANRNPIELERIYVQHSYHDKKVGAALMAHCIAYAKDQGHDVLWLGVWEHNYRAVKFYQRWGFELFGSHPFILGDDHQTDVLMKKEL